MFLPAALVGISLSPAWGQRNIAGETEIRQALDRLGTVGSVMMIGAHPDDENTALLAYFSRGRHVRTAYLSLTRGEGGQNLIGSEQGDELGIIRTQELLAARRIDGAEQFFTRAIDFGFTKTAAETLTKWPREKVLSDVVWVIRSFRPDVIVLRFTGTPRDGHGQHQVSAIVGKEAFTAAADPAQFPEQLKWVQPWQAKRLLSNVNAGGPGAERDAAPPADRIEVDAGEYIPELGYSYGEIAGMSRSQHRSQAMGSAERKGSTKNYLVTIGGDKATKDVFDGVDISWTRFPGGAAVQAKIDQARDAFQPKHPEQLLPVLAETRALIAPMQDSFAKSKLTELDEAMGLASALWVDASADRDQVTPGGSVKVNLTAIVRTPARVTLTGVKLTGMDGAPALAPAPTVLVNNQPSTYSLTARVPDSESYTQPYWLVQPRDGDMYSVADPRDIGKPENPPALEAHFMLTVAGAAIEITRPVAHRYVDRVYGELVRPLAVVPPVAVGFEERAQVFADIKARTIEVPVRANVSKVAGDVGLEVPAGWKVEPASRHFDLAAADQQATLAFELTPPSADSTGVLRAVATVGDRKVSVGTKVIQYTHMPTQTLFPPATARLVRAGIITLSKNIGYIMGAGDDVPAALRQMGCQITLLSPDDVAHGDLSRFDTVITGVRAFNTRADLRSNYERLFEYVNNGGTLIVQYNVPENGPAAGDPTLDHIGPYPIKISRENKFRVTEEDAAITFPNPQNPLLHKPNEITAKDFDGWVQERGLYFAYEWDPKYQTVLESHDTGEQPVQGGELYARHGKGVYIFSAYDWFRELPAGVPGAYRLFANMMSAAKTQ